MQKGIRIENYFDKIYGCWLGKIIGGTLGFSIESFEIIPGNLNFYYHLPKGGRGDDDTDAQIIRLEGLMKNKKLPDEVQLAQEWVDLVKYNWCEYGDGAFNFKRGLLPPLTGFFDNYFGECMGATVRTEIWAMLFPGLPEKAAIQMYKDAIFDHCGDGIYTPVFLASAQSMAFIEKDIETILKISQSFIPKDSNVNKVISDVFHLYKNKFSWDEAKKKILEKYHHPEESHTLQNIGIICLSLLYGEKNFEKTVLYAVNSGCDADTTGAKVAAFLGIINGASSIPDKWKEPIEDSYYVDWGILSSKKNYKISDLAKETIEIAEKYSNIPDPENNNLKTKLLDLYKIKNKISFNISSYLELELDYGGLPTIGYDKIMNITINLYNKKSLDFNGEIILLLPKNWKSIGSLMSKIKLNPNNNFSTFTFKILAEDINSIKNSNKILIYILKESKVVEIIPFALIGEGIWYIIGPFGNEESDNLNEIFEPERIQDINKYYSNGFGEQLKFNKYSFPEKQIDLSFLEWKKQKEVIYVLSYFYSLDDKEAKLQFASNDGFKVWHNDTMLLNHHMHSDTLASKDIVTSDIYLRAGWNKFLIKLIRCSIKCTFRFFLTDRSGTYNFGKGLEDISNNFMHED